MTHTSPKNKAGSSGDVVGLREAAHARRLDIPDDADYLTEVYYAQRFVAENVENARYVTETECWYVYTGHHWQPEPRPTLVKQRMIRSLINMRQDAQWINDTSHRKAVTKSIRYMLAEKKITSLLLLAETEPGIRVALTNLDANPYLFGVQNGVVDLRTGEHRAGRREDLISKVAAVEYDENAQCPSWKHFVSQIMANDKALVAFLQRFVGYTLTGSIKEQCMVILCGEGANGKSTFLEALSSCLGADYSKTMAPDMLVRKRNDRHPTERADLQGARMVISTETDDGLRLDENLVKQLTGGDKVKARFMHQDFFEYMPQFKIWLATNHSPIIKGHDHAIWRRMLLIYFTVIFDGEAQDRNLLEKLHQEKSGILNWAIQGCLQWQKQGLQPPDSVIAATAQYRHDMDVVARFLEERCMKAQDYTVGRQELHGAFLAWCKESGVSSLSIKEFKARLERKGFKEGRTKQKRQWRGLRLCR